VEHRENPRFADRRRNAVPVHVRPQIPIDRRVDYADLLLHQFIKQIAYRLPCGVVETVIAPASTMNQWARIGACSLPR
jgi:hypothetical protein